MLPRIHRFSPRKEELNFYKTALIQANRELVIYAKNSISGFCWRATVVVPKKVSLKATSRSAIKRRLRNALVNIIGKSTILEEKLSNTQLVVVAKPAILNRNQAEISNNLENLILDYLRK